MKKAFFFPENFLGEKLLVMGEINTGKTTLCQQWLKQLCLQNLDARIVVLDLAPYIPKAIARTQSLAGVGGYLLPPPESNVLDLRTHLQAPRLSSATESEANEKAMHNVRAIEALLEQLAAYNSGRDVLFINDVTLYLQAGSAATLLTHLTRPNWTTLVVNGYWGQRLGNSALSDQERAQTQLLRTFFERQGRILDLADTFAEKE